MTVTAHANESDHQSGRIVASGLTKIYRNKAAVNDLSFTVEPGSITGFLGPNGAGKSTTMRMLLGLSTPTRGSSTINGVAYADLADPTSVVGSVLDPRFHPGRTGRDHLRIYCAAAKLPDKRADEVLHMVGLDNAANRRTGGYSLGMRQRLGLATALLGDPRILLLDEPANGLDPEGIAWLRRFLQHLAAEGRTILVSSHILQEVEQTVDRVIIIARGELVREGTVAELAGSIQPTTIVRSPDLGTLREAYERAFPGAVEAVDDFLRVTGPPTAALGEIAFQTGTMLHELTDDKKDLEYLYFQLTGGLGEYETDDPAASGEVHP
ncbi:ABC transporter ATP-binding protein [Cumulibacter soli]|uniref:ABC transporter ATP-binding protein n=1 Tax=Cumulibacter soli TaxID=2546344 RepID=UPI001067FBE3|nr:ABC transporter ATP-binding protein [Cumulibacter soli]